MILAQHRLHLIAILLTTVAGGCSGYQDSCSRSMRGIDDCAPGLTCTAEDGGTGVCVCASIDHNLDIGDACNDGSSCQKCRTGLRCNSVADRCITPNSIGDGGACSTGEDCQVGLICNGIDDKCEVPHNHIEGHRCSSTNECEIGTICGTNGLCARPGVEGVTCGDSSQCAAGFACNTPLDPNHCAPLGIVGSLCVDADQCEAGLVCSHWFSPAQCAAGAIQDRCLSNSDCQPGSVCTTNVCW